MSNVIFGPDAFMEWYDGTEFKSVGCAVSAEFTVTNELIGKTSANAGLFRQKRVRISDMSASINGLMTLTSNGTISPLVFLQEAVRRTEQIFRFSMTDSGGVQRQVQGNFLIESWQTTAESSSFCEYNISLQGTGGFAITAVDPDNPAVPGTIISDWWETTPGTNTVSGDSAVHGYSFAGQRIIEVDREGLQQDEVPVSPGNRQYSFDGSALTFDPTNPFNDGERIFVIFETIVES